MNKHRILLVVKHPVGGIRTFFRYVYTNIGSSNYDFTLIAPDLPETRLLLDDLKDLHLQYVPARPNASSRELFGLVTTIVRGQSFGLIHSHGFTSAACTIMAALYRQIPHVLTCHDVFTPGQFVGLKGLIKRVALGAMLSMVDRIHCVSNDARANLLAYLPILKLFKHKVVTIFNGIEVEPFVNAERRDLKKELGLPSNTFLIGFMGRFMAQKGFRYLVDALEQLKRMDSLPGKPLVITFSQPDGFIREEQEQVKKRGLGDSILFLPFVPNVAATLKGLDIVAMPSLWEACGLLAMETMAAGTPIVGTDCIGLREVLRNTPAYIVPAKDGAALSEALALEMRAPTTARTREFSAEAATRFQVKDRAAEIEKLMRECLKVTSPTRSDNASTLE
ncbi:MAG: glycosyltransferase family 4 protein [Nitrospira sp.]|nr:glycosyltransferase family 4 protein [Nitrospira sp.]